jgi:hypothetical protein
MKKREEPVSAAALVRTAAVGGGVAIVLGLVLAAVCTAAVLMEILPEGQVGIAAVAVTLLAVFCGCLAAARAAGGKRLFVALGAAAVYGLAAFLGKTAFHGSGGEGTLPVLAAMLLGCLGAGLLSSRQPKKHHRI